MYLAGLVRSSILLLGILMCSEGLAQQNANNQFKEVQLAANAFSLAEPVPAWVDVATIPDVSKPNPIVIRLADTQFLVDREPVTYVRRATLVNDAASLTNAGRFSIGFAPEYERVQLHAIHIHRGQDRLDRTSTSTIRFLQREQGLEQGIYSGRVTASILIDDLRVGDTLDVSYSTYGQNPVYGGKFTDAAGWDQAYPTLLRRVILNHPLDRQIAWRMIGDRPPRPIVQKDTQRDGMRKIEFEERSLPETVSDAQVFPDFFAFRFLQFSEYSSWADVANWANGLFPTDAPVGDDLRRVVDRIRSRDSDEARIAAALEFVQSEIRYFSVSLGESSHRPASPEAVLRRRYGDCKDKSFLLVVLLRELGIQSRPVLLQIGRRFGLEKTLPSAQFFDHAIVQVTLDGKTLYLDPTRLGQHGRLDRMGQAHEGAQILVVAPAVNELSTISTGNIAELVREDVSERATLPKFGDVGQLQIKRMWTGVMAERVRVMLERASREQVLRWIGDALERRYPGAKLAGEPTIQDDPVDNVVSIAAVYDVPKLAVDQNGTWFVYFTPENMQEVLIRSPTATRTMPLRIGAYPYQGGYSFEITFPEDVSVVSDPSAETIENKYFSLTATRYFRGNIAKTSLDLKTLQPRVEAEDSGKFADDMQSANKAIGGFFAVGKSAITSRDDSSKLDFPQRMRDRRQEFIEKATETIKGGKLSGTDLADAYCNRSNAFSDLQRDDEAVRDANEAVRLAPNSTDALGCRAGAYFRAGQFDKSVADFSKAISLGAKSWAFHQRGVSKLYAGRLDDAAVDFARADELADKETRVFSDMWLVFSYGRLGKPVPDTITKRAAAEASGEWPRPALAMLTGAVPPEELLKLLDEKKGDERHMALAEGYFYLGQHYLNAGDKKTAEAYFEKTRALDVIIYTEHTAAGFELQRMKNDGAASMSTPSSQRAVAQ